MVFYNWIEIVLTEFIITYNSYRFFTCKLHDVGLRYFEEVLLGWIHPIGDSILINHILLNYL